MRVDKVIIRAALSTLAAIVILFAFMFGALWLVYPSTMMNITYDLGMEAASIGNAKRAYERTDEIYYIAFATEIAIETADQEQIKECGWIFISDDEFATYCDGKNAEFGTASGVYEQYVYAQVCVAEYHVGDKTKAVNKAFEFVGDTFPENNAAAAVVVAALKAEGTNGETIALIKVKMNELKSSQEENAYFQGIFGLLGE